MQVDLSGTLHGAEKVTKLDINLFHQLLERVQPALFNLRQGQVINIDLCIKSHAVSVSKSITMKYR